MSFLDRFIMITSLLFGVIFFLSCTRTDKSTEVFVMPDLVYMSPAVEPQQKLHVEVFQTEVEKHKIERLDLVVFKRTELPVGIHILRVLGLPGDTVRFSSEGIIVNDGQLVLPEELSYLNVRTKAYVQSSGESYYEVPDRALFLVGDNMSKAFDSRIFGAVTFDSVYGKVVDKE